MEAKVNQDKAIKFAQALIRSMGDAKELDELIDSTDHEDIIAPAYHDANQVMFRATRTPTEWRSGEKITTYTITITCEEETIE